MNFFVNLWSETRVRHILTLFALSLYLCIPATSDAEEPVPASQNGRFELTRSLSQLIDDRVLDTETLNDLRYLSSISRFEAKHNDMT